MQPTKEGENKPANVKLYAKKNLQNTWKLKQEFHKEHEVT